MFKKFTHQKNIVFYRFFLCFFLLFSRHENKRKKNIIKPRKPEKSISSRS